MRPERVHFESLLTVTAPPLPFALVTIPSFPVTLNTTGWFVTGLPEGSVKATTSGEASCVAMVAD